VGSKILLHSCRARQECLQQSVDRTDSFIDWTIDGTHSLVHGFLVVLLFVNGCVTSAHLSLSRRIHRNLHNNNLSGQIPSMIGQLTALTYLFVIALMVFILFTLFAKGFKQQPIGRTDSSDNWAVDSSHFVVCYVDNSISELTVPCFAHKESFHQLVDRTDSDDDWSTNIAQYVVRFRATHRRWFTFFRRALYNNRLSGQIPSAIEQLSLNAWYESMTHDTTSERITALTTWP
jgi:hypothetical protein